METATPEYFSEYDRRSIHDAVVQEIKASGKKVQHLTLDVDAIQHVRNAGGQIIYCLVLSSPVSVSCDQTLTFQVRSSNEKVSAVVLDNNDEGLLVAAQQPLPTDIHLLRVSFDPAFILRALDRFIDEATLSPMTWCVLEQDFPLHESSIGRSYTSPNGEISLDTDQSSAVNAMQSVPVCFLWGPPGTGKTTTLGVAAAHWFKQRNKRVLIVSMSNVAVDVAMKALLKCVTAGDRKRLLRLGTPLDPTPALKAITLESKCIASDFRTGPRVHQALDRLTMISKEMRQRTVDNQRFQQLWAEKTRLESEVDAFNRKATASLTNILPQVSVVGCTLARMVLERRLLEENFDVVIVDETSMVSLAYALGASTFAQSHLVYAGDPLQLPPICQSNQSEARHWLGSNIYDWIGIKGDQREKKRDPHLHMLRTQYRMTNRIGGLVSRLSYGNALQHGRNKEGVPIEFVELPVEWQRNWYSVREQSYYQPVSVPIIHQLAKYLGAHEELLLLSPFRPQRSLLTALAFDLKQRFPKYKRISASTIHRSQGSEGRCVIVDLTTHSSANLAAFFRDQNSANLSNVAISRAKDKLIIIGSCGMIKSLAKNHPFWKSFESEIGTNIEPFPANELLDAPTEIPSHQNAGTDDTLSLPVIYSHSGHIDSLTRFVPVVRQAAGSRKLVVVPDDSIEISETDCVIRHSDKCPPLFTAHGYVCIPYSGGWLSQYSPNVSQVLWRIGFSHLADEELNPLHARAFFCPECATGDLRLITIKNEGWFLACHNAQAFECHYRRRLSLEDAKLKVRMNGMKCPEGHPLTVRTKSKSFFLGCENYPQCDYTDSLSILRGM